MGSLWTRRCDSRIRLRTKCGRGRIGPWNRPLLHYSSTVLRKREEWFAICHTDDNNLQPKVLIGLTKHMAAYCT